MPVTQVADAVAQMAALRLSTNVLSMTIIATKMPFVGTGRGGVINAETSVAGT